MKNVIITGATGMLGLALIDECTKNNTNVTVIIRDNSHKRNLIPVSEFITTVYCDVSGLRDLRLEERCYDAFYHFAWESTDNTSRNNVDIHNRNIGYTLDALRLAERVGCSRFIGAGSQAEYGRFEGVISPDMKVSPENAYGVAKYTAGKLSGILAEQLGIDFIWARIFSIYGVNDALSTMVMYCVDCLLRGVEPLLTPCEQQWDYLNCRDASRAMYLLGGCVANQRIYNIGSGTVRPLLEYVHAIRDAIDPSLPLGIGKREYALNQVMHLCADISGLKKDTGFSPSVLFQYGISETIKWYRGVIK